MYAHYICIYRHGEVKLDIMTKMVTHSSTNVANDLLNINSSDTGILNAFYLTINYVDMTL